MRPPAIAKIRSAAASRELASHFIGQLSGQPATCRACLVMLARPALCRLQAPAISYYLIGTQLGK
jgi:hypothetical protein